MSPERNTPGVFVRPWKPWNIGSLRKCGNCASKVTTGISEHLVMLVADVMMVTKVTLVTIGTLVTLETKE